MLDVIHVLQCDILKTNCREDVVGFESFKTNQLCFIEYQTMMRCKGAADTQHTLHTSCMYLPVQSVLHNNVHTQHIVANRPGIPWIVPETVSASRELGVLSRVFGFPRSPIFAIEKAWCSLDKLVFGPSPRATH